MRRCIFLSIAIFLFTQIVAQSHWQHGRLKVGPDKYSLEYEDGTPFFWLGDTGWEIFSRLTLEEMITYFDNRSAKGFNVVQATVYRNMI